MQKRFHSLAALVALFVFSALSLRAETPAGRAAKFATLSTVNGHRVLHLRGDDIGERGFAVGYLFAEEMISELETAIKSLPGVTVELYNNTFIPWSKANFAWDADGNAEMEGLYAGLSAKLGDDGLKSKLLGRALNRDDIAGINTLADYFG